MKIEELESEEGGGKGSGSGKMIVSNDTKRVLVGAGARILFYPTLLYNVFRNKIEADFRWWDEIDQHLLLGAVPFPKDVPRLKQLGVGGVITLNEPYETLVPTSLYYAHEIDHLVIPTRDYLFAPSFVDINRAVDFIHKNKSHGQTTYVHCKAGRGRSTTIVLCYLAKYKNQMLHFFQVKYKHMTPAAALEYVRAIRPRVLLAPSQWKAVQRYSKSQSAPSSSCVATADEVLITEADLEGYICSSHENYNSSLELSLGRKATRAMPMIARLSCLFTSLKDSGSLGPISWRLLAAEARAC
ncbi:hypothetical protein SAY87_017320 [Trapa incisa]|uniref:phosphatidylglycerophosphatase n=1 Tax=Trapa incisa TaxID=236973 RepID=A0AAN7LBQ3_9MYRT|nr:hypothetical protein SAY87_017320 [Trapa incisa]